MSFEVLDLGLVPYEEAHARQLELLDARVLGDVPDTLLLLEHPPVITLGRGTDPANVLGDGVPIVSCERGGDVTLHAPGQLVGYVIRLLEEGRRDLHAHLRDLEELVIRTIGAFEVNGIRSPGRTGVWVEDRKIASLGVACRRWCTWHGLALNVDLDLAQFTAIHPCGFPASVMTSLARELGTPPPLSRVKDVLAAAAREVLAGSPSR